jgi:hypothetical protein
MQLRFCNVGVIYVGTERRELRIGKIHSRVYFILLHSLVSPAKGRRDPLFAVVFFEYHHSLVRNDRSALPAKQSEKESKSRGSISMLH